VEPRGRDPDLRAYFRLARRRRWLLLLVPAIAAASAYFSADAKTPMYRASSDILVARTQAETLFDPLRGTYVDPSRLLANQARIIQSEDVAARARQRLGYTAEVDVAIAATEDVITITAVDTDPERVAATVNAFAQGYLDYRRQSATGENQVAQDEVRRQLQEIAAQMGSLPADSAQRQSLAAQQGTLQAQLVQLQAAANVNRGGAEVLRRPVVPKSAFSPKPVQSGLLGLGVGLLLGVGLAFLRDYLDDRIRTKEDLDAVLPEVPVLAIVPRLGTWKNRATTRLASVDEPSSDVAEAYRSLRTSVQFRSLDRPLRVLQVTSAAAAEGKTTTVANLAVALARAGQRVAVIDGDLRRPRLHDFFGLRPDVGFTSVLLGDIDWRRALVPAKGVERLWVLPAGPIPPDPSEVLSGARAAELLEALADHVDVVILDSPPVLPVADASALATRVDGVLVVVNAGATSAKQLRRAIELLAQVDATVIGTALNGVRDTGAYGAYGYAYGYRSSSARPSVSDAPSVSDVPDASGNGHLSPPAESPDPAPPEPKAGRRGRVGRR
jgi:capsular exopolysaccharide synthesis family protein